MNTPVPESRDGPLRRVLTIVNERGLHARAAAKFVKCVEGFDAQITVLKDDMVVSGGSIMGLMMLGAAPGTTIELVVEGRQAKAAVQAVARLVESRFGED